MISTSELSDRITIRRNRHVGYTELNEPVYEEIDLLTIWAHRLPAGAGGESFDGTTRQRYATSGHVFRTRFRQGAQWFAAVPPVDDDAPPRVIMVRDDGASDYVQWDRIEMTDILVWAGIRHDITGITELPRRGGTEITCQAKG